MPQTTGSPTGGLGDGRDLISMKINCLVSSLSVRNRIVVLAIIPLLGFLATGIVATLGETQVERTLGSVKRATALADVA